MYMHRLVRTIVLIVEHGPKPSAHSARSLVTRVKNSDEYVIAHVRYLDMSTYLDIALVVNSD